MYPLYSLYDNGKCSPHRGRFWCILGKMWICLSSKTGVLGESGDTAISDGDLDRDFGEPTTFRPNMARPTTYLPTH